MQATLVMGHQQVVKEEEHPGVVHVIQGPQLRWNTANIECFAIFMALQKFHYLIHNVFFTLRSDGWNVMFIITAVDGRVFRWKSQQQKYNFQIEHNIAGKLNIVANCFSRLESNGEEAESAGVDDMTYPRGTRMPLSVIMESNRRLID
mmetsp:Transcript_8067/g.11340  ORF Transcript_8067/g.11340 Transcript_8067/m.11340 type:complete len:148 (+) Transcript_8067:601-1044(+)